MSSMSSTPSAGAPAPPAASAAAAAALPYSNGGRLRRVDTLDLKAKLAAALGANGRRYWTAFMDFVSARISRVEFEEEAQICLKPQHIHLHNQFILGILYNASADVPGPSSPKSGSSGLRSKREGRGTIVGLTGEILSDSSDAEDDLDGSMQLLQPPRKRLRALAAGLSKRDRARVKSIAKAATSSRALASGGSASLGWAGAGADMLEKKRKEEDKRRTMEEKRKVKEVYTEIGARDWREDLVQSARRMVDVHNRLSLSTQQAVARGQAMPLCVESKELPSREALQDIMTVQAVDIGLPAGVQPQAAALLLAALQCHLQNVTASIIAKIRANRQTGIRSSGPRRPASEWPMPSKATEALQKLLVASDGSSFDHSPLAPQDDSGHSLMIDSGSATSSSRASPVRALRTMASDLSSTNSSSANLGIPGSGNQTNGGRSLADESMISFVSTAPTSLYPGSTSSSSENDREMFSQPNGRSNDVENNAHEEDQRAYKELSEEGNNSITLRDLSFLLDVAPHTVVEPLGLGTQSRLLAPDWNTADENAQRADESSYEGVLAREARSAATSKVSDAQGSAAPYLASNRGQYVIDQLAPVRILDRQALAETQASEVANRSRRRTKGGLTLSTTSAEKPASAAAAAAAAAAASAAPSSATTGDEAGDENSALVKNPFKREGSNNQSASSAGSYHHHHRGTDPHLYDVVDPVALLGSLVN